MSTEAASAEPQSIGRLGLMGLAALGVVFGDIGTSPLYTLKIVLDYTGPRPDPAATLGALSLILWTLLLITTVKYVNIAMRIDNDGEGGIIALMTLLGVKQRQRPLIIAVGLFGAALIYGDGAITPAISVLSALEGVEQIAPSLQTYVLPAATAILLALFAAQPFGAAAIGRAFGPIMLSGLRRSRRSASMASCGTRRSLPPSIRVTASTICRGADCRDSWSSAAYFCASRGPRRCTPTWDISGRSRSASHGVSSFFRPSFSITRARPRSCSRARRPKATSSTGSARGRC